MRWLNRIPWVLKNGPKYKSRDLSDVTAIIVHANGLAPSIGELAESFRTNPDAKKRTGGKLPYHLFIKRNGDVEQGLPFDLIGPHALEWNDISVAVCLALNPLKDEKPTRAQQESLEDVCTLLFQWITGHEPNPILFGHMEANGAFHRKSSSNENHKCPGDGVNLSKLWDLCRQRIADAAGQELVRAGAVFRA